MSNEDWQFDAVERLVALLEPDPDVVGLALGGSLVRAPENQDAWSDVDALVIVRDASFARFFPGLDWIRPLGRILGYEQHPKPGGYGTLRVCFVDFRRFDLIIMPEGLLAQQEALQQTALAWRRRRTIFYRATVPESVLDDTPADFIPPPVPPDRFDTLVNAFWFKGVVAIAKVARGDLLVALHLALDLTRECLVLAMMLRDREGGEWDRVVEQINSTRQPHTSQGILDSLEESAATFDWLAVVWSPEYEGRADIFRAWVDHARESFAPPY